jgi:hypothetical protein
MDSPHDRLMDDDHLPNDRWAIHDPALHDGLNDAMDYRALHDRLDDFSLNNTALDNGAYDVALDERTPESRCFEIIFEVNAAAGRPIVGQVIIFERVATTELRSGRSGSGYGGRRKCDCHHTT